MQTRKLKGLLKYEFFNTLGNFFTPFFGLVFPIIMGWLITSGVVNGVPEDQKAEVATSISMSISLIIPFSTMLVSFPAIFSQETEQGVTRRLILFNFTDRELMLAKVIVHYLLITLATFLYILAMLPIGSLLKPALSSFLVYLLCYYLLATLLFVFAYSVTSTLRRFGTTYAVTMTLYFALMGLSGMMGAQPDQLPKTLKKVAFSLPMAYMNRDFIHYWVSGFSGYNFAPLIQAFLFMTALVTLVYLVYRYKNKRRLT